MRNSNDLAQLIREADQQARHQAQATLISKRQPIPLAVIFCGVMLTVIASAVIKISAMVTPPSDEEIARDLNRIVQNAQTVVESIKKDSGTLPENIPNASLASIVKYERRATEYRLSAAVLRVRVTLESNGGTTTEIGK